MEAAEFLENLDELGSASGSPNQAVESYYAIEVRLTEAEHKMLQRLKELTGQDDSKALRTGLRLFTAMMESGDSKAIQEMTCGEVG